MSRLTEAPLKVSTGSTHPSPKQEAAQRVASPKNVDVCEKNDAQSFSESAKSSDEPTVATSAADDKPAPAKKSSAPPPKLTKQAWKPGYKAPASVTQGLEKLQREKAEEAARIEAEQQAQLASTASDRLQEGEEKLANDKSTESKLGTTVEKDDDFVPIPTVFEGSAKTLKDIVENNSAMAQKIEVIPKTNVNISNQLKAKTRYAPKKPGSKFAESTVVSSAAMQKPDLVPLAPPPVEDEQAWKPSSRKMFFHLWVLVFCFLRFRGFSSFLSCLRLGNRFSAGSCLHLD